MKKIHEIDSVCVYERTGVFYSLHSKKHQPHAEWRSAALSPAQLKFLMNVGHVYRPHPKDSLTIELFVDEHDLTDRDWTAIRLLF